jgi:predicted DNA-binding protein (UPF0251 family)
VDLDLDHLFSYVHEAKPVKAATKTSFKSGHVPVTAVLTPEDVVAIRQEAADGIASTELAKKYGISYTHVRDIVTRQRWRQAEALLAKQHELSLLRGGKSPHSCCSN